MIKDPYIVEHGRFWDIPVVSNQKDKPGYNVVANKIYLLIRLRRIEFVLIGLAVLISILLFLLGIKSTIAAPIAFLSIIPLLCLEMVGAFIKLSMIKNYGKTFDFVLPRPGLSKQKNEYITLISYIEIIGTIIGIILLIIVSLLFMNADKLGWVIT